MELKKDFMTYFAEAKDAQKAKENSDLQNKDASHGDKADVLDTKVKADKNNYEGDKADVLDPSINEADAQKAAENANLKANDASKGEKADVLDTKINEGDEKDGKGKEVLHGDEDCDDDEELDETLTESRSVIQKNFTADIVGKMFSACSHEEGTDMPGPGMIKYVGRKNGEFQFEFLVYDKDEGGWYTSSMSFKFDYSSAPIASGFKTSTEAFKTLKGTKI